MRAPALRTAALDGTLNRPACPACGRRHVADAELVYADPERGHWVSVSRPRDLARWSDIERAALAAFRTTLETAAADAFVATHIRVVFGLDELRERLAIWAHGFDDGVIECVKLECLRDKPLLREGANRIRVVRFQPSLTIAVVDESGAIRGELAVTPEVVERIAADGAWGSRFPELFASGFVSIDRYLQ